MPYASVCRRKSRRAVPPGRLGGEQAWRNSPDPVHKANSTEFISLKLLMSVEAVGPSVRNSHINKTVTFGLSGGQ